jgi:hypothetical protein
MYFTDTGVPKDVVLAHMWLNLPAAQCYQDAENIETWLNQAMERPSGKRA